MNDTPILDWTPILTHTLLFIAWGLLVVLLWQWAERQIAREALAVRIAQLRAEKLAQDGES